MPRLHLPHASTWPGVNPFTGLVDFSLRPAGTEVPASPPGVGWADERAAELRRQGVDASVMRPPGQSPVVTYRLPDTRPGLWP